MAIKSKKLKGNNIGTPIQANQGIRWNNKSYKIWEVNDIMFMVISLLEMFGEKYYKFLKENNISIDCAQNKLWKDIQNKFEK